MSSYAQAATSTWTRLTGSTDWNTAADWGGTLPISGTFFVFNSANASPSATLTNTLTTSAFNVTSRTFNSRLPAYTMTGNTFNLNGSTTAIVNNALTPEGIFNNSGQSPVTFANTGGLTDSNSTSFGLGTGGITITNGLTYAATVGLTSTLTGTTGVLTLGSLALNAGTTGGTASAITDTITGTGNVTVLGAISDGGAGAAPTASSGMTPGHADPRRGRHLHRVATDQRQRKSISSIAVHERNSLQYRGHHHHLLASLSITGANATAGTATGVNATGGTQFTYGGPATVSLTKCSGAASLTYTVGPASPTGSVLVRANNGVLVIQTSAADLGIGALGENFKVTGTAPAITNGMVDASIVSLGGITTGQG